MKQIIRDENKLYYVDTQQHIRKEFEYTDLYIDYGKVYFPVCEVNSYGWLYHIERAYIDNVSIDVLNNVNVYHTEDFKYWDDIMNGNWDEYLIEKLCNRYNPNARYSNIHYPVSRENYETFISMLDIIYEYTYLFDDNESFIKYSNTTDFLDSVVRHIWVTDVEDFTYTYKDDYYNEPDYTDVDITKYSFRDEETLKRLIISFDDRDFVPGEFSMGWAPARWNYNSETAPMISHLLKGTSNE